MKDDRMNYGSDDLQRTMEIPGQKKNDGIVDPWSLNSGGVPDEILKTIAQRFKIAGDLSGEVDIFEVPETKKEVSNVPDEYYEPAPIVEELIIEDDPISSEPEEIPDEQVVEEKVETETAEEEKPAEVPEEEISEEESSEEDLSPEDIEPIVETPEEKPVAVEVADIYPEPESEEISETEEKEPVVEIPVDEVEDEDDEWEKWFKTSIPATPSDMDKTAEITGWDTIAIPAVKPSETEEETDGTGIKRNKTVGGRIWPAVLTSCIFVILACIITITVGIVPVFNEHGIVGGLTKIISPVLIAEEPPKETNILLVGVDKDGYRTDTMMVATYDNENKGVYIIQLPRDTYVPKNGRTDMKLNSAYYGKAEKGGLEQLKKEIKMAYGIEVHKYVEVDLKGFRNLVDAIGGVEFDVPINMFYEDPYQDLYINLKAGKQILDGEKAEQFVRFRKYPMGDLARMQAQKDFLMATVKQLISVDSLANINGLIEIGQENVKTDLTFEEIYSYAVAVLSLEDGKIEFVEAPGQAMNLIWGSYFIVDYDEAKNIAEKYFHSTEETLEDMKRAVITDEYITPATNDDVDDGDEPDDDETSGDDRAPSRDDDDDDRGAVRRDDDDSDDDSEKEPDEEEPEDEPEEEPKRPSSDAATRR